MLAQRTTTLVNSATELVDNTTEFSGIGLAVAATVAFLVSIALWRTVSKPVQISKQEWRRLPPGSSTIDCPCRPPATTSSAASRRAKINGQQLAQLDRLKAEFVSVASHELKTPINVILGYLQLLNEGVYGSIYAEAGRDLRTLGAQTRSLSRLVHQLLDMSRFEAGGGKLDLATNGSPTFLSDLESTFEVLAMQRGIHFRVVRRGRLPTEVMWDHGPYQRGARQPALECVQVHEEGRHGGAGRPGGWRPDSRDRERYGRRHPAGAASAHFP